MTLETSEHPTQLGNYDVLEKIAEGGMGTVYKARSRVTGAVVAIKVIAPGTARNPVLMQRFEREFQAARVLEHPNVVKGLEYCGTGPHPFLVMEYVDGESVGQRIERDGAIPEAEAVRLVAQVCDGLQRAHKQGLVHRDVKPDNVLITREGVAKLTDMGLVKEVDGDLNLTKTGRGLGTPHYMAPEQFRNAKGVDVRGDIYSLGATLYAMVTGRIPFDNANPLDCWMRKIRNEFPSPKELNPAVSDRVDWAIRRAMSADPARRPASCREFLEDLTGQSRGGPPGPTPAAGADLWYMVYKDETGQAQTVKGGTEGIRQALRDGLLGDPSMILVGRSKAGQFLPLQSLPEFRDLVVDPLPGSDPRASSASIRRSGTARPPGPRPGASEVDIGTLPPPGSGASSRTGRPGPTSGRATPASGRHTPASGRYTPASGRYTPQPASGRVTPPATPRPRATVAATDPHSETLEAPVPTPPPRPHVPVRTKAPSPDGADRWTPVVMVLVALLSGFAGFLLFMR